MKHRYSWLILACAAALVIVLAGCQKSRTDAQITGDVQNRINADAAVQSRCLVQGQCSVQVSKGVVTLNGNVPSDAERAALASDAAQVEGVKTVVNNLQVAAPAVATAQPTPEQTVQSEPMPARRDDSRTARKPSGFKAPASRRVADYSSPAQSQPMNMASNIPTVPVAPPPQPRPVEVTIPEGTTVSIRLIDPIDSERNQSGDHFRATLDSPIVVGDKLAIPAGADIYGRVTNAKSAAHFSGRSALALELSRISMNGKSYDLHTDQYSRQGTARGKNTAAKVGTGAALGAIIGAIAGGGKGAAIGGAIGAGAGTGAQAATHGEQIRLTSEQALSFHLESPLTVTAASRLERNAGRQRLDVDE
jgi:uncharacterized membrane protein